MIGSYLIYIGLSVFIWTMACWANRRDQKGYVWLIIGVLTLVAGLRDASVGMDTANYLRLFDLIDKKQFSYAYGLEEPFKYLIFVILKIVPSKQFVLVLLALIANACIIIRFWELRKLSSFSCMVLCYYMAFYFMTFNAMRQFCAVGIVFYCTRFLDRKKVLYFVLGVLAAWLFHRTALIGFIYLALNCLRWKELPTRQRLLYIFAVLCIPVLIPVALKMFASYARYFKEPTLDIGMMLLLKFAFLVASMIFAFGLHRRYSYLRNGDLLTEEDHYRIRVTGIAYTGALGLAILGYIFPHAERIGLYFYMFEPVYFGILLKGKKPLNRVLFFYFIAFVIGYSFVYSMTNNSQGNMPYAFFW